MRSAYSAIGSRPREQGLPSLSLWVATGRLGGCNGGEASEARGAVAGRIVATAAGAIVWLPRAFECRVDDCESGRYGQPPGDHDEGQFEGQNGASGRLSELVAARVS